MSRCRPSARRSEAGVSLLELMLAIVLLAIFIEALYESVILGVRTVGAAHQREGMRQQVIYAVDRLTREARMALDVTRARDQDFQFDADFNGDGQSNGAERDVRYRVRNGVLERSDAAGPTTVLLRDLGSIEFDYVEQDGDFRDECRGGCDEGDLRIVRLMLTASKPSETMTTTTSAFLANMGL